MLNVFASSSLSFTTQVLDGSLESCPFRVALQFMRPHEKTFDDTLPLDEYDGAVIVPVAEGTTTLRLAEHVPADGSTALAGMQWEFTVSPAASTRCSAFLTIDDIRLTTTP